MDTPEQRAQSAKFGYKAPESVYKKHDPKASLVGSGTYRHSDDTNTGKFFHRGITHICRVRFSIHHQEKHLLEYLQWTFIFAKVQQRKQKKPKKPRPKLLHTSTICTRVAYKRYSTWTQFTVAIIKY